VVIATPDPHHATALQQVLSWRPSVVVCEKPLALSLEDAERAVADYAAAGIPLIVNFSRRFDSTSRDLRAQIRSGVLGTFLWGTCKYSKGILHNGIHAFDFFNWFLGAPKSFSPIDRRFDYTAADPTVSAFVEFESGQVCFLAGNEREFSVFEIELAFTKGRFVLENSGHLLREYEVLDDPLFPGYRELFETRSSETKLAFAMQTLYGEVEDVLKDRVKALTSPARDSLACLKLVQSLIAAPLAERNLL
jgi:predicted dehydrogenase